MPITHSRARPVLDRVRELLGVHYLGGKLCGMCGAPRPYNPHEQCPVCQSKPVLAENIIRAIREVVAPTKKGYYHEPPEAAEQRRPVRASGSVETLELATSGRRYTTHHGD